MKSDQGCEFHFDLGEFDVKNSSLVDFYQGWLIEVLPEAGGFQSVCYSPVRGQLYDDTIYIHAFEALTSAKHRVSRYLACCALAILLRELYEFDKLEFEEWRSLSQSLSELRNTFGK